MRPYPLRPTALLAGIALCLAPMTGCGSARAEEDESRDLAAALELETGSVVADVGAGDGEWAVGLAEAVGPTGHVYATEVDEKALGEIRRRAEARGVPNLSVVAGTQTDTGLDPSCCDAVLLRMVYHHFTDPEAMGRSLLQALRPGGLLVVVDISPQRHWSQLPDVPDRGGHGIPLPVLIADLRPLGFRVVSERSGWDGDEDRYCVVFRAPRRDF